MDQTPAQRIYYALRSVARFNKNFNPVQLNAGDVNDGTVSDFERLVRNGNHSWRDRRNAREEKIAKLKNEISNLHHGLPT